MPIPTASDLRAYLQTQVGIVIPDSWGVDYAVHVANGLDDFHRLTGFDPWQASATATTRRFDPPGSRKAHIAFLRGGGTVMSLRGGAVQVESVRVLGRQYVIGESVHLLPQNCLERGRPVLGLEFRIPVYTQLRQVEVTARWGYEADMGAPARRVVLDLAAYYAVGDVLTRRTLGDPSGRTPIKWDDGDHGAEYEASLLANAAVMFQARGEEGAIRRRNEWSWAKGV